MDRSALPFGSLYRHGFARVAVAVPRVRLVDPHANAEESLRLGHLAAERGAALTVFPELGLTGYTAEDLFHQQALLETSVEALGGLIEGTAELSSVLVVGVPLQWEGRLFICAVAIHRGKILGVVPKQYLPNYREFYEKRQFSRAASALSSTIRVCGQEAPFGSVLFKASDLPSFSFFVEICEDLWVPTPPSSWGALAGATVLCNLSASNATVAKADYRESLCRSQSGRCIAAYLYAGAGCGESTTDLAWDSHGMIWENGAQLAASRRYHGDSQLVFADIDVERLELDRMRMTSFQDASTDQRERIERIRTVTFELDVGEDELALDRQIERFPYVPSDSVRRDERCEEVYNIQVHGLAQRLEAAGIGKVVIGVSGGLDSTQALLVATRTFDRLGLARSGILAYSLPGLATSERTRRNALELMSCLGVTVGEIDISDASKSMLERIGHPYGSGEEVYDVTFENAQAGERTSLLFRLANLHSALVVGTGDLSELALGWCTYGVGDHMSHYGVNSSVPKTLVQHLIRWVAQSGGTEVGTAAVLQSILETEISPELIPGSDEAAPSQRTEETVGPFDLQDFNLYYLTRFGFRPSKVAFLALCAWGDRSRGGWPEGLPDESRKSYSLADIKGWLEVFLYRFFERSQFKRSALPNGPKVGSGGSLSPRGDWRAPSDSSATAWVQELRRNVPG